MNALASLPPWAALTAAALLLAGALLSCLGSFGLLRLEGFYPRVHAPTLGTTLGMFLLVLGATLFFSLVEGRLAWPILLIALFLTLATPITLTVLVRAARARDDAGA